MNKPAAAVAIHRAICARNSCEYLGQLNYADPCAGCPNGHFGIYSPTGCEDPARTIPTLVAIKHEPWPLVLLPLKLFAQPRDRGAGDIIARKIGPIGGDAFKLWYKRIFGKSCGCGARQEILNARWPM